MESLILFIWILVFILVYVVPIILLYRFFKRRK